MKMISSLLLGSLIMAAGDCALWVTVLVCTRLGGPCRCTDCRASATSGAADKLCSTSCIGPLMSCFGSEAEATALSSNECVVPLAAAFNTADLYDTS